MYQLPKFLPIIETRAILLYILIQLRKGNYGRTSNIQGNSTSFHISPISRESLKTLQ